jgi:hypothetical protein
MFFRQAMVRFFMRSSSSSTAVARVCCIGACGVLQLAGPGIVCTEPRGAKWRDLSTFQIQNDHAFSRTRPEWIDDRKESEFYAAGAFSA